VSQYDLVERTVDREFPATRIVQGPLRNSEVKSSPPWAESISLSGSGRTRKWFSIFVVCATSRAKRPETTSIWRGPSSLKAPVRPENDDRPTVPLTSFSVTRPLPYSKRPPLIEIGYGMRSWEDRRAVLRIETFGDKESIVSPRTSSPDRVPATFRSLESCLRKSSAWTTRSSNACSSAASVRTVNSR